jgi:Tol biopolymer transport system component
MRISTLFFCGLLCYTSLTYGQTPKLFGEGVISTPFREWTTTFTPDGKTVYFSQGASRYAIVYSENQNGHWQKPKLASFSGLWYDTDPFISLDGQRLYFCSNRPADQDPAAKPDKNFHIWMVQKTGNTTWSSPVCLDTPINLPGVNSWYPSESMDGHFYFHSWNRPGGHGYNDIYASIRNGNTFSPPTLLPFDTAGYNSQEARISGDDEYMLFVSNRPGGLGVSDLYISFHKDKEWSKPQNLGPAINTPGIANMAPALSIDGSILYFTNNSGPHPANTKKLADYDELLKEMNGVYNGLWNIYYVPLNIPDLRAKAVWER